MHKNNVVMLLATSLLIGGCRQEPEDKTPASWKLFVEKAESGEAPYFKQLAVELEENGMSYEWISSNYDFRQNRGEIRVIVTRPDKEPLKIGYLFELEDGIYKNTRALDYRDHKAWP